MAYFPNGTSADYLYAQCADCPVGKSEDSCCPVLAVHLQFNYDQCDKGQEKLKSAMLFLIDKDGDCQMRKQMLEFIELPLSNASPLEYLERTAT